MLLREAAASGHTMDYDPLIKSQLASRNQLWGLVWCKFGHMTLKIWGGRRALMLLREAAASGKWPKSSAARQVSTPLSSKQKPISKGFKDFCLEAKARIWP